jgi:CRISPR/Cas system CSM-associated protein Csm3 (group 7 of RAMP superfamily)
MDFEIIGKIRQTETFAHGSAIRELQRLQKVHGLGNWRKRKGYATVRLSDGTLRDAEIHWYEANGIGKREFKIKRYLDMLL